MTIIGHTTQQKLLDRLIDRDRVPSALLFSGVRSIGKRSVAEAFARKLLCEQRGHSDLPTLDGCGACGSCRTARHGNNPDFIAIDCQQKESGQADAVRSVLAALGLKAFGSRARVVILDNADELSLQLGNMLLKNLEEPRPNT
jgi:DNA polymerase III gamma/tau subunit